jgi:hypothetical protein
MRFEGLEKTIDATLKANTIAIAKAEQATEHRLTSLNEFRQSLSDQTKTYVSRQELEAERAARDSEIKALQKTFYTVTAALAVIVMVLMFFVK